MAQTPESKTVASDQSAQSKAQAAANQTVAAENAAITGMQSTTRQGAEAARQTSHVIGETLRRTGPAGAEAARLTAQVGAETTRRSVERLADGQRALIEDVAEQFEQISQQMVRAVQETAVDIRGLIIPPRGASENLGELQDGVAALIGGIVQSNVRLTQQLLQMANPSIVFDLQRRFVRDYTDALLHGSSAIIRAARKTADQTLQPIQERIEQRQGGQQGNGQRHQPVVADVMSSDVRIITPEDTVQQATRLMRDEDTGVLPVARAIAWSASSPTAT